ncbi:LOW QUALITY PROTEIN: hypothetical protein HID58_034067 [Brassica napus]|uniref:Uncharacterized protein n=1 Tax=Brassica napus TaxID=3708 RepID=A0ABQ8C2W3_BRANA|nr:LOW QUALITY PROTEIN: hypothetical protein HID58_034067 [Brassica napus]
MDSHLELFRIHPCICCNEEKEQVSGYWCRVKEEEVTLPKINRKNRELDEVMNSFITGVVKSSITALALEMRETAHAAPASYPSHFATPASTGDAGATPASTGDAGATPASTHALASDSTRARAPTANPASTHTSAPATSHRRAPAPSCSGAPTLSHTCGPASSAKIRSQTKDPELSDVFGSLFDTLNVNLGTQEHLQKTMGNLTQESHVNGEAIRRTFCFHYANNFFPARDLQPPFLNDRDDQEVRCKDIDYELVFVLEDKFSKLSEWILKPKVLQIGSSKFDANFAYNGTNEWLRKYDIDIMMYLFREKPPCVGGSQTESSWPTANLEIARVAQEMKQKLKIAMVAMVVVGAIVGIWTSLTV